MFHATLICSDEQCTEVFDAYGTLEELETLSCDCGFGLVLMKLSQTGTGPQAGSVALAAR